MVKKMTIVMDIINDLINIRKYKKISEEKKEWGIEVLAQNQKGEDVLIWGLEKIKIVGIKWVRVMAAEMKNRNIPLGIIVGGSRSTKAALKAAEESNIDVITRELQLSPILKHKLVPEHQIMSEEEVEELLKKMGIKKFQLPWIKSTDPVAKAIGAKPGDVIRIIRESPIAGKTYYYRYVVS